MVVGLTGGIGSGKTTVLELFKQLGAKVYVADVEAKRLMNSNSDLISQIKLLLGNKAYKNNVLNSAYISGIVFKNKEKLKALNALVHPIVREDFNIFSNINKDAIIIYEAAILFESGGNTLCDYIVTVTASFEDKIERIIKRDNTSKQQILDRMQHQLNDDYKIKHSSFVINNSTINATKAQVLTTFVMLNKLRTL